MGTWGLVDRTRVNSFGQDINSIIATKIGYDEKLMQAGINEADRQNAQNALTPFIQSISDTDADPEKMFGSATSALQSLKNTGGPHSQRAAKEVIDVLEARMRLRADKQNANKATKPQEVLLNSGVKVQQNGVTKLADEYGYIENGKPVVTNRKYQDFTPNASGSGASFEDKEVNKAYKLLLNARAAVKDTEKQFGGKEELGKMAQAALAEAAFQDLLDKPEYMQNAIVASMIGKNQQKAQQYKSVLQWMKANQAIEPNEQYLSNSGYYVDDKGHLKKGVPSVQPQGKTNAAGSTAKPKVTY